MVAATRVAAGHQRAIVAQNDDGALVAAELVLRGSPLERNHQEATTVLATHGTIENTPVRGTLFTCPTARAIVLACSGRAPPLPPASRSSRLCQAQTERVPNIRQ